MEKMGGKGGKWREMGGNGQTCLHIVEPSKTLPGCNLRRQQFSKCSINQGFSLIRTFEKKCHSYIFVHFRTYSY